MDLVDGGRRRSMDASDSPSGRSSGEWSRQSSGNSRLPWRKGGDSPAGGDKPQTPLSAAAQPWSSGSGVDSGGDEKEPDISHEDDSVLDGLETRAELDTVCGETRHSLLEPGTAEEHRQAEEVAVKAVAAALHRIASGVNMKGMVRMGSSNALQALGVGSTAAAAGAAAESPRGDKEMAIHRVPSRSGLISSMVKVASFGNLGKLQKVGSLNDLQHAGVPSGVNTEVVHEEEDDEAEAQGKKKLGGDNSTSWADMSLLVIAGGNSSSSGGNDDASFS